MSVSHSKNCLDVIFWKIFAKEYKQCVLFKEKWWLDQSEQEETKLNQNNSETTNIDHNNSNDDSQQSNNSDGLTNSNDVTMSSSHTL